MSEEKNLDDVDTIFHALRVAFEEAYHRDHANSAIHDSPVQFRPLTVLLGKALARHMDNLKLHYDFQKVIEVIEQ